MLNILLEASPLNNGVPTTIRMSSAAVLSDGVQVDGGEWLPVITELPDINFSISEGAGQVGPMTVSMGDVSFRIGKRYGNLHWNQLALVGQPVTMWIGQTDQPFSAYRQFFTGTLSGLARTGNIAKLTLRTVEGQLDVPLLSKRYAGTGAAEGPAGKKGQLKPYCLGNARFVTPVQVDPALLVYQVHGYGPVADIPQVYEFAQAYAPSKGDVADWAALSSATLIPGEWITCKALGMFRLGGRADKLLTADVIGGSINRVSPQTVAGQIPLLLQEAGVSPQRIGDMSALNFQWSFYATEQTTVADVVKQAALDAGGYVFADKQGNWQSGRHRAAKTPVDIRADRTSEPLLQTISELNVTDPTWKVEIGHTPCWTVHSESDISPKLTELEGKIVAADEVLEDLKEKADAAAADAAFARAEIEEMIADGVLDRSDKRRAVDRLEASRIQHDKYEGIYAAYNVASQWAAYDAAWNSVEAYMTGLQPSIYDNSANTSVDRTTYLQQWAQYEVTLNTLLAAITGRTGETSLWAGVTGEGKPENYATVGAPNGTKVGGVPVETLIGDVGIAKTSAKDAYDNVEAAKKSIALDVAAAKAEGTTARNEVTQARNDLKPLITAAKAEGTTARTDLASEVARAKDAEGTLTTKVTTAQTTADAAKSAITTETTQRTDADSALSNRTTAVESTLNTPTTGVVARLTAEETARATADTAISNRTTALEGSIDTPTTGLKARIATEETTRANADTSLGNRTTAVESTLNTPTTGVVARLGTEETTRASADTALATRATNLESTVNSTTTGNNALQSRIATEETTRSTAVAAVANRTSTLETKTGNNGSYATANASFTAWPDGVTLPSQWSLWNPGTYTRENSTFQNGAYMVGHVVPSTADSGLYTSFYVTPGYWVYEGSVWCSSGNFQGAGLYADNLPSLNFSTAADNSGDIGVKAPGIRNWSLLVNSTYTGQVNFYAMGNWSSFGATSAKTIHWLKAGIRPATDGEIKALKADALLNTPVTGVVARITTEETTRANADTALSNRTNALESTVNTPGTGLTARIGAEETTRANAVSALANRTTSLEGSVNTPTTGLIARMSTEENARAAADSAIVNRTSVLEATATASGSSYAANDKFANWPNAAGYPTNWQAWNTEGTYRIERVGSIGGSPYAIKTYNDTANATSGFVQSITIHPGKWVVEATVRMDSGGWSGAGVTIGGIYNIDFVGDPDSNKQVRDSIGNGDIRTWTKMFDITQNQAINFHGMVGWTGFNRTISPKYVTWFRLAVRPATAGEILAGTVDTNLTAAVARIAAEETARINADSAIALRTTVVESSIATGGNLLPSSTFVNTTGWVYATAGSPTSSGGLNIAGDSWHPVNENALSVTQSGAANGNQIMYWVSDIVPVNVGQWYQYSAYVASHRADVGIGYEFYNTAGTGIASGQPVRISRGSGSNGGQDLNGWDRVYFNFQATNPGTRMQMLKWPTNAGNNDSYAWFVRPQLVQVANGSAPIQAYRASSGGALLTNTVARVSTTEAAVSNLNGRTSAYWQVQAVAGNNRAQMTVRADANGGAGVDIVGDVNFSGNLNVGPDSGQRTKITNQGVFIYDGNGTRRVALGINF